MARSTEDGSARIYQFPVKLRAAVGGRREEMDAVFVGGERIPFVASGGAWYHDEAIREAEHARKTVHRFPTR